MLQVLCGLPHSPVMRYSPASPGDGPRGCLDGDGLYLTEDELLASLAKSPGFASDPASASGLSLSMVLTSLWLFSCSVISNSVAPRTAARQASLSFTMSQSLLKLMSIESAMHLTISSSATPFSFCLQSCPASGSFLVSQFFESGGQSIAASASVMKIQG